jgi:hypothetical protein
MKNKTGSIPRIESKGNFIPEVVWLEKCPFCGSEATIIRNPGSNWDGKQKHLNIGAGHCTWYVGCPSQFFEDTTSDCEIHPAACWYAHLDDAIDAWNNRRTSIKGANHGNKKRL